MPLLEPIIHSGVDSDADDAVFHQFQQAHFNISEMGSWYLRTAPDKAAGGCRLPMTAHLRTPEGAASRLADCVFVAWKEIPKTRVGHIFNLQEPTGLGEKVRGGCSATFPKHE